MKWSNRIAQGFSPISVNFVGLYEKFGFCPEGAVGLSLGVLTPGTDLKTRPP